MYTVKLDSSEENEELGFKVSSIAGLRKAGMPVNPGFVITPRALDSFVSMNGLRAKTEEIRGMSARTPAGLRSAEERIRELFEGSPMPSEIRNEISTAYAGLSVSDEVKRAQAALNMIRAGRDRELVAVRPSITRDPHNSFAGITDSFLNVTGDEDVIKMVKRCWASFFFPKASSYMERRGITDARMSVIVQKMALSEKSGMMMTGFGGDKTLIEASWGLGKAVSSGMVTPDEYLLDSSGKLLEKNVAKKMWMLSRNEMTGITETERVPGSRMDAQVLTDMEIKKLSEMASRIRAAFQGQHVIDWSIGRNRIIINDIKPDNYEISPYGEERPTGDILLTGRFVSKGSARGTIKSIDAADGIFGNDNIVVMSKCDVTGLVGAADAGGIVTDCGGRLCNLGMLSRELQIPMLSATQNGSSVLRDGEMVHMITELGKIISVHEPMGDDQPPAEESQFGDIQPPSMTPMGVEGLPSHGPEDYSPATEMQAPQDVFMTGNEFQDDARVQDPEPQGYESGMGMKVFAKCGPDMIGRVPEADGLIVHNVQTDPAMLVRAPGLSPTELSGPVWVSVGNDREMQWALDTAGRLHAAGKSVGIIMPVVRGPEDIEKSSHLIPAGIMKGICIKTPAMMMSVESLLTEGVTFVNVDLRSLVQLSMGLQNPDQALHESILGLLEAAKKKCSEREVLVSVTMESLYITDDNIDAVSVKGADVICTVPGEVSGIKEKVSTPKAVGTPDETSPFGSPEEDNMVPFDFNSSSFS